MYNNQCVLCIVHTYFNITENYVQWIKVFFSKNLIGVYNMIRVKLKEVMKMKNINKSQLSRQTNISRNTLYLIENHKTDSISFDVLNKLCSALNCTVGDLLEYIPDNNINNQNKISHSYKKDN
jgi:putative transcriptional regulator